MERLEDLANELRQAAQDVLANTTYDNLGEVFNAYSVKQTEPLKELRQKIGDTLTNEQGLEIYDNVTAIIVAAQNLQQIADELYPEE